MQGYTAAVILVIDVDPVSLATLRGVLESQRYSVLATGQLSEALSLARANSLDLIISDVNLRGVDGLDVVEQIRSLPESSDVPMLFLSSAQVSDVAYRSVGQSSAYFVKKPASAELLLDLVEKSLWMPHLIRSQMHRPHLPISTMGPFGQQVSMVPQPLLD
ncbi:MAG TPA: response regulator [Pirellulaceae bacterium]|nr:response regulator [Pirellulaceae bacterium]